MDGEGQDFALIEAASVVRRNEFRNMIAIHTEDEALADALGTRSIAVDSYEVLDISRDIDSEELAATIERIAESSAIGVTVLLPENAVPMMLMRVLSILRLAAPAKVYSPVPRLRTVSALADLPRNARGQRYHHYRRH